jgi:FtsZ-binding cell division protein ZapB
MNNYEVKQSAILQMEIDYLRDELSKYKQENIELREKLDKRRRKTGTKVYSIIIKNEDNVRLP